MSVDMISLISKDVRTLQVSVVGPYEVDAVFGYVLHQAVIGIGALVVAGDTLPALVACNAQCNSILGTKFFKLSHLFQYQP